MNAISKLTILALGALPTFTLLIMLPQAEAQRKKGLVSSAPCPYSCRSNGISGVRRRTTSWT